MLSGISLFLFWFLFILALGLFAYRAYQLYSFLRLGKSENRFENIPVRIWRLFSQVLPQTCSLKSLSLKDIAGLGHALIFWGFLLFLLSYIIYIFIGEGLGLLKAIENAAFSRYFLLILDFAAVFVAVAIIWAAIRRYIIRPPRLEPTGEAAIILALIFSLMLTHLLIEGLKGGTTPVASLFARFFDSLALSEGLKLTLASVIWWIHYLIILSFLVYIPYSKHLHIFVAPINIFFSSLRPRGALVPIALEESETFGVARVDQFTWKQLLDLYACTQCGRCEINCPAWTSGKPLSPKKVILDTKEHLLEEGPHLLHAKSDDYKPAKTLIGEINSEDAIWACTTCFACQEQCPSLIEHISKLIDMRRNLILEQAKVPETAETILRCIEDRGHSCRGTLLTRTDWTAGLEIKLLSENKDADFVFWVGCAAALETRSIKIAIAMAKLLQRARINFSILGAEEACCGDPARRMGNEYLFQIQAQKNIEVLKGYNVKKLITICPHCFNTLKNEYPQFGAKFEVIHHSQLLSRLLSEGKLKPAITMTKKLTFHDSCYLGRYNNIYEPPRTVLSRLSQTKLIEMERSRRNGFCCGGGGGRFWMEERIGKRISEIRTEEIIKTEAEIVATACPYCLQMFEDAIKAKEAQEIIKAMDIAELMEAAISK